MLAAACLVPLASFVVILLAGPHLGRGGRWAGYIATGAIAISFVLSAAAAYQWFSAHPLAASAGSHDAPDEPALGRDDPALGDHDPAPDDREPAQGDEDPALGRYDAALSNDDHTLGDHDPAPDDREPAQGDEDPALGRYDAALSNDDPALGDDDPSLGRDDPALGGHDPALGGHAPAAPSPLTGTWYTLARFGDLQLGVGYYIDSLTIAMFLMVGFVATC
ncbi:MAG: hypothetical protein GYA33_10345, partial [Thermogutta sp.]|nr:hypothetical protein [Thermogutta sp.]